MGVDANIKQKTDGCVFLSLLISIYCSGFAGNVQASGGGEWT